MTIQQHDSFAISGLQGYSSPLAFSNLLIFCVGNDIAKEAAFKAWATYCGIGFKPLVGSYKGVTERPFMIRQEDADRCAYWYKDQESVLHLGPQFRNGRYYGHREATLLHLQFGNVIRTEKIGLMQYATKEYAMKQDAWTYCPAMDMYWVAEP